MALTASATPGGGLGRRVARRWTLTVVLDGSSLTIEKLASVARNAERVELAPSSSARMAEARSVVVDVLARDEQVYGLTTGVAERKDVMLVASERRRFNRALLRTHRVAQGPPLAPDIVRGAMACLVNSYASGYAGVRPVLAEMVLDALNEGFVPSVRSLGSVGMADLAPLADLGEALLDRSGLLLEENEGLALLSSNAFATSSAALSQLDAERLLDNFDVAAALDLEAFGANLDLLHPIVGRARRYDGIVKTVANLRALLEASSLWKQGSARNLQDPLTFRCVPQIHGAARDALAYVRATVATELNSAQGNPLVVVEERRIVSTGSSDPLPIAAALDFARLALAPVVASAAERTVKLLQRPTSGLASGLAASPERGEDGLAELAVVAQSLAVEARLLAAPVSFELVSTSKGDGIEDRTTMAPLAARRLSEMVDLASRVLSVALVVGARAVELREPTQLGAGTHAVLTIVRRVVPSSEADNPPGDGFDALLEAVRSGVLAAVLRDRVGDPSRGPARDRLA